jgi:hypothetical protein
VKVTQGDRMIQDDRGKTSTRYKRKEYEEKSKRIAVNSTIILV